MAKIAHNVALFGGAFNPIGIHHEKIAQRILDEMEMRTWFMPCHQHRFSKNADLVDEIDRLAMSNIAANTVSRAESFDFEIRHELKGSTFETMLKLEEEAPQIDFYLVVGLDNANIVETLWDRGPELIKKYPFIVASRPGIEPTATWYYEKPHTFLQMDGHTAASSTDIRTAIKERRYEHAQSLLNPKIWDYIVGRKLFGYEAEHAQV